MFLEDGSSSAGDLDGEGQLSALTRRGLMPSWRSRGMTGGQMGGRGELRLGGREKTGGTDVGGGVGMS